jgi:hypothetical protein
MSAAAESFSRNEQTTHTQETDMKDIDTDDLQAIEGGNRPDPGDCYYHDLGVSADAMIGGGFFSALGALFCP